MLPTTEPIDPARQREIVRALRRVLPATDVLHEVEDTRPFECDGLTAYRALPMVVALPSTREEVQAVLRVCHALQVPVVPRGAGTGLSGGALPRGDAVLLSLARLSRVLRIDPLSRIAMVESGVRNAAVSEAAAAHGLYYAPDPSSQIACTVGGNIAENSGGVHCLKYGLTVHNVLCVRGFDVCGEAVEFGSEAPDAAGYDLLATVIGSEGLLAVVTEATLRLLPKPPTARVLLASFDDVERAGEAVAGIIAAGIIPAGLEMMDRPATRAAEAFTGAGYDTEAAAILLCEADGTAEDVDADIGRLGELLMRAGATRLRASKDEAERQRFWSGRKSAFPAVGRLSPDYYCMDGTIPRRRLGEVLRFIAECERNFGLRCPNVFHAGDGNLHPLILFDAANPGELERTEAFAAAVLEKCIAVGGTVTGEHGVGVEKLLPMCGQFGAADLGIFHGLKGAFDPAGKLNPGKAVPSLHRCAEHGAMRIRGLASPPGAAHAQADLPRF